MAYSKPNTNQFIHPFTFFIMNKLELVYNLYQNIHYSRSANAMNSLIIYLDPEIQKVLAERKSFKRLHNYVFGNKGLTLSRENPMTSEDMQDAFRDILICLHVAGYFDQAKGGVPTRSKPMRNLEEKLRNALSEGDKN